MRVIGKILYGSQNYHLDNINSDKDYKIFCVPEFTDLFQMKEASRSDLLIGYNDPEHNSAMDIRKFNNLLQKGNINCIEYLFSSEFHLYDKNFVEYFKYAKQLYEKGYVVYVWNYFFSSLQGMILNSLKRYGDTEEGQKKSQSRAIFWYNFTLKVINNNFSITQKIWNDKDIWEPARECRYKEIKTLSLEEWKTKLDKLYQIGEEKKFYFIPDTNLTTILQNIIARAIKEELENK